MTFEKLLARVSQGYPDDLMLQCWNSKKQASRDAGDTLALFLVRELHDTYDSKASDQAQLAEAERAICMALYDLEELVRHVHKLRKERTEHDEKTTN